LVNASDSAGNNASDTVTFNVDNTPPVVKIVYPLNGTMVSGSSIFINGSIQELNKGDNEPSITASNGSFILDYWDGSSGTFSFVNTTGVLGNLSAEVSFTDLAGNTGSASVAFKVEPEAPTQIPTVTTITQCGDVGIKGSSFTVLGTVVDSNGSAVDGVNVLVYLTQNKSQLGMLCGEGETVDGGFNITCYVDLSVQVGSYQVIAYTPGNGLYQNSSSDPQIRILADTSLTLNFPSRAIMGRSFIITGTLDEKLSNLPIANQTVTGLPLSR
jgi:hypothetical protein